MYFYESHMGGFYTSDTILDYEDLYCDQCNDTDWLLGEAHTVKEFLELLDGYSAEYIKEYVSDTFHVDLTLPSEEELNCKKYIPKIDKNGREYPHCKILNDYCYEDEDVDFSDAYCERCGYNLEYELIMANPPEILNTTID